MPVCESQKLSHQRVFRAELCASKFGVPANMESPIFAGISLEAQTSEPDGFQHFLLLKVWLSEL